MTIVGLAERVQSRYRRSAATLLSRRPFEVRSNVPLISFTFDDFPRSALHVAGAILHRYGLAGTYYASFGLMGTTAPTGPIFVAEDLNQLFAQGHELGCHTFAHCHAWDVTPDRFERSVVENRMALNALRPGAMFRTCSYPISPPRPQTKRASAQYFSCCRGGGQAINLGMTDLNHLSSYFIEKSRTAPDQIDAVIEENRQARGWLILNTHDVCDDPTPYGCTPALFERVVRAAVDSGAVILPVIQAFEVLESSKVQHA